ncbi:SRPBCC domain-containing protein [Solwaraspora sp. WMMD406]|uniref:SRPBCC family protein n=1 Tax=Solwaraspora sp. WMMD406 TaxID=3016095 RepID=UPI002417666C|nr:SRPBCC domain-containing protein [Solwaraspora sp. WMMD406]MDG4768231.1 SRPBCC domain-containing protein [Solwaraspora sp. WMMD406]
MTVISSIKDEKALTLTVVAEFDASVERVWRVWSDPRQLERWWGPPSWPATFEQHEFVVGGRSHYYMTGPEGEKARGLWTMTTIAPPHRLEFEDSFADDDGNPSTDMAPIQMAVTIEADGARTHMTMISTFDSVEHLDSVLAMGMAEGLGEALGQIDDLLAEATS